MEQGGDYLWVIKENQPTVKEALSLLFARPPWGEAIPEAMREASHRGRREWPWLRASSAPNHYLEWPYAGVALCRTGLLLEWPYVGQVCCMERTVPIRG